MKISKHIPSILCGLILFQQPLYCHAKNTAAWNWSCNVVQSTDLYQGKVIWKTLNCNGTSDIVKLNNLNINVIYAPTNDPTIKILPRQANTPNQLAQLPAIADELSAQYNILAGINGGYFYRNDVTNFNDNICPSKTKNPPKPTDSMGDSLLQYNNATEATNCVYIPGVTTPRASLILTGINPLTNKPAPYITLVNPDVSYKNPDGTFPDAIGAGPNLITDGKITVDNPEEGLMGPTLEFAANTAVGIINDQNNNPSQIVLFTVDGNDQSFQKNLPAMNAAEMADFLLNYLKVNNAISMDQGGSTTMYVAASDLTIYPLHVVSNSNYDPTKPRSADNIRNIYDGIFIATNK